MRKLASIRKIEEIRVIPNADKICAYRVGGWWVVDSIDRYVVGDLAIYFEIDSFIPHELAPFLSKGKEPREFEGVKGERLRTIRLKGQISQGLLLPVETGFGGYPYIKSVDGGIVVVAEDDDVSEHLGIKKWEKPIHPQLAGIMKGPLPTQIPRTDQERVQNLVEEITQGGTFAVTEKLEGSSMTVYRIQGEFGVCSRNIELVQDENNSFWRVAIRDQLDEKMKAIDPHWDWAIQGELIGPGIQGNIYGLKELEFRVFDVCNIQTGEYLSPVACRTLIERMGLKHVPVLDENFTLEHDVDELLAFAEGQSQLAKVEREGVVFKQLDGDFSFKAISNRYLIKSGE